MCVGLQHRPIRSRASIMTSLRRCCDWRKRAAETALLRPTSDAATKILLFCCAMTFVAIWNNSARLQTHLPPSCYGDVVPLEPRNVGACAAEARATQCRQTCRRSYAGPATRHICQVFCTPEPNNGGQRNCRVSLLIMEACVRVVTRRPFQGMEIGYKQRYNKSCTKLLFISCEMPFLK